MGIASDTDRTILQNIETMEYVAFPLTPIDVATAVEVNYSRVGGIGASCERLVYQNTGGETTELEFPYFRVGLAHGGGLTVDRATQAMNYHRNTVRAWTLPTTREDGMSRGAPPECLLTIPGVLAWRVRILGHTTTTRTGEDGGLMYMAMRIRFQEVWDSALSSEAMATLGYSRG